METKDKFKDRFAERYRHCDMKNAQYEVVDFEFEKNGPTYPPINVLTFEYNKLKLEYNMKITFNEKPCKIYLKTVCATLYIKKSLKRNSNLQIISIGFSDIAWKVFASLMNLAQEKNNKLK